MKFRELSLWERDRKYVLAALAVIVTETALLGGLIVQATRRRRAEAAAQGAASALRASFDRIRDLGGRLLGAQEEERSRIARELHDDISQQLTLLSIDLDLLSRTHHVRDEDAQVLSRTARTPRPGDCRQRATALARAPPGQAAHHRPGRPRLARFREKPGPPATT